MENECVMKFNNYTVNHIEFYGNPEFNETDAIPVEMDVISKVRFLDDEKNTMYVNLEIRLFEEGEGKKYPFKMNVALTGEFELKHKEMEIRKQFAKINAVSILFPYARALISTCTAAGNVGSFIIPPLNIIQMIQDEEKETN